MGTGPSHVAIRVGVQDAASPGGGRPPYSEQQSAPNGKLSLVVLFV